MNLYNLHSEPEYLDLYSEAHDRIPNLFWEKYKDAPAELKKREQYIAKNAKYSYMYAVYILKGPFKAGEAAITTSAHYSYIYAKEVLNGPFKAGEASIASSEYKLDYEKLVGYSI
jgi:hypothetical protein